MFCIVNMKNLFINKVEIRILIICVNMKIYLKKINVEFFNGFI